MKERIYIKPEKIANSIKVDDGKIVHKIRHVLRLKVDDELLVFDGQGKEYGCRIESVAKSTITLKKEISLRNEDQNLIEITLGFPLIREGKIDFILQKATELGVNRLIPFICQRTASAKISSKKLDRWRSIIIDASRQSGRLWIPKLDNVFKFDDLINIDSDAKIYADLDGVVLKKAVRSDAKTFFVAVGPEGGFSIDEKDAFTKNDFAAVNVSDNVLRVETAAIFCVGLIKDLLR
ncbi:MAG: 16S rRNA (uracil(1498)-N(3))-methyltransferase [Candidatus Omnitrophica bacterium]|nr:16S rRNA (uracil(1498)-N(3))-methyltransferase [Candidatus Omnitrophota bacterium]